MARARYMTKAQVRDRLRNLEKNQHNNKCAPAICPYCKCKTREPRLVKGIGWTWDCAGGCHP